MNVHKPLVISAPEPRDLDLIFTAAARAQLHSQYRIVECTPDALHDLDADLLNQARYIIGQPPISDGLLECLSELRAVLNVEGNLYDNMPYQTLFERGIHVLTTNAVFAEPVAELGVALALNLARGVIDADHAFARGEEIWGLESNRHAQLISGSRIGFIGFGELGRALQKLLVGFRANMLAYDPWLPDKLLLDAGVTPASQAQVLENSDLVYIVASVTSENAGLLDREAFRSMKPGAMLVLLSRAAVVDFDSLLDVVEQGHITAASDVFPEEPPAQAHRVRQLPGFIRSAHRAGALDVAFKRMGDLVLADMALMDRGLPPQACKRAERETVTRMRSNPVSIN